MSTKEKNEYKTAIIGAGVAGLSAAVHLHNNGFGDDKDIIILEAKERNGGRMFTVPFGNNIIELGANWIHGSALNNSMFTLACQQNLMEDIIKHDRMEGFCYTYEGRAISKTVSDKVYQLFQEWKTDGNNQSTEHSSEVYFKEKMKIALQTEEHFKANCKQDAMCVFNCLLNYYRFHIGGDLNIPLEGKNNWYHDIPGGNINIPTGMSSFIRNLTYEIPDIINNNEEVQQIIWGPIGDNNNITSSKVTIKTKKTTSGTTKDKEYIVDHVIVTIPLGNLKKKHESLFVPPLPVEKKEAIEKIGFGKVNKIFLKWNHPFWHKDLGGIKLAWTSEEVKNSPKEEWWKNIFAFDTVLNNENVLVAWLSGEEALVMERLPEKEVLTKCTELLRQFLRNPSIPPPNEMIMSKWCTDPHFLGSYSYWATDTTADHVKQLSEPLYSDTDATHQKPTVLFAGEATSTWAYATMHGARSSGIREAERIKNYDKKQ